jgi:hypothetical protein
MVDVSKRSAPGGSVAVCWEAGYQGGIRHSFPSQSAAEAWAALVGPTDPVAALTADLAKANPEQSTDR